MRRSSARRTAIPLVIAAVIASTAIAGAQRRNRNDNAAQGTPVATNTILAAPDRYYGTLVTVSAGVEQMLSKTIFLLDQRRATGPNEVKSSGKPILVIAPNLTASLDRSKYLLVRGEVVRLEPAALERLAPGYALDLDADGRAKYATQPVLVASSVIDSTYVELAKKRAPPEPAK